MEMRVKYLYVEHQHRLMKYKYTAFYIDLHFIWRKYNDIQNSIEFKKRS